MSLRKISSILQCQLLLCLLALPVLAADLPGATRWSGEVRLSEAVTVPSGATLTIAAGTHIVAASAEALIVVSGKLLVEGTQAAPVLFDTPSGWRGIQFVEGEAGSRIRHARFARAASAVSTIATDFTVANCEFQGCEFAVKLEREASPVIENCWFADNGIGIANEMKSGPTIRNNRFSGHTKSAIVASHGSRGPITGNRFVENQQGIGLIQRFEGVIADNQFNGNDTAIFCNQTQNTPRIEHNRFEGNKVAVANISFAYPTIVNNQFLNNGTALHNDQYGSSLVEQNLFRGNGTALYNNKKSNPKVRLNHFEKNELALFCDFSSYPEVRQNNFVDNAMGVKLGIYQSADWEKRSGSKQLMQREASTRQSQNPLLAKVPTEFTDIVDVSGNWWGKETALLTAAGEKGNVPIFHDRYDQPEVSYEKEGYGPGTFRLDRIQFAPWLKDAVPAAGVKEKP
ncbi:MAG: right-handed parallel beta-helix repeat-containing protein [Desulfuromonadales bacterium]|nr:right-handed parallel beta-helix repeat-containing protein [Desulfuromonadales bacterium]